MLKTSETGDSLTRDGVMATLAAIPSACALVDLQFGQFTANPTLAGRLGWADDGISKPLGRVGLCDLTMKAWTSEASEAVDAPLSGPGIEPPMCGEIRILPAPALQAAHAGDKSAGDAQPRPGILGIWSPKAPERPRVPPPQPPDTEDTPDGKIEAQSLGMFMVDPQNGLVTIDALTRQILGLPEDTPEKISQDAFFARYHPADQAAGLENARLLDSGQLDAVSREVRLFRPDGGFRHSWITVRATSRDAAGTPTRIFGTVQDQSQTRQNERRLKAALSDAKAAHDAVRDLRDMIAASTTSSNIGLWNSCPDTGESWFNDVWYTMLGYAPAAFPSSSSNFFAIMHDDDIGATRRALGDLWQDRIDTLDVDFRLRNADGDWVWITSTARKVDRSDRNLPPLVCGTHVNVTRQKSIKVELATAADAAQTAEARLCRIADNFPGGLFEYHVGPDGQVEIPYFSSGAAQLVGTTRARVARRPAAAFINVQREDLRALASAGEKCRTRSETLRHRLRTHHPWRGQRWILITAQPFDAPAGGTTWYGGVSDITTEVEHQEEVQRSRREAETARDRLNLIAEGVPAGMFQIDMPKTGGSTMPYLSANMARILQLSDLKPPSSLSGVLAHLHGADRRKLTARLRQAGRRLEQIDEPVRVNTPDGEVRLVQIIAQPQRQPGGTVVFFGHAADVTEQNAMSTALEKAHAEAEIARAQLARIADNLPGAIFEFRKSANGDTFLPYYSKGFAALFGIPLDEMLQNELAPFDMIHPDDAQTMMSETQRSATDMSDFALTYRIHHPQKGQRWVHSQSKPHDVGGGSISWYGILTDVTDELDREAALDHAQATAERERARVDLIANNIPGGLFELQMTPDTGPRFVYGSHGLLALLDIDRDTMQADDFDIFALMPGGVAERARAALDASARTLSEWVVRFPVYSPSPVGLSTRWLLGTARPQGGPDGRVTWYGRITDETDRVAREQELQDARKTAEAANAEAEHQALHDALTGLPNRRYFDRVLAKRIASADVRGETVILVRIDLDHFKYVNDTLGHEAGDAVLWHVGAQIRSVVVEGDFYARLGGDEFVMIMAPGADEIDTNQRISALQTKLRKTFMHKGRICRFGASFGVASTDTVVHDAGSLLSFADAALYRAKERGRNRVEVFTKEFHEDILVDRRLADEIQAGLEQNAFEPYYQPQVHAADFSPAGVEVLVRWNHPERGLLAPGAFLDVAEQIRVVADIDRMMFDKAAQDVFDWEENGVFVPKVSFNLSLGRLRETDVQQATRAFAPMRARLAFELVESILIEDETASFAMNIDAIKEAGIELEVDDFGSGHASIVGLMHVGPDTLKIDQRLIRPLDKQPHARKLISAIVQIGDALNMKITAEGVETMAIAHILRDLGCDTLQGYAFAKPLSKTDLVAYMNQHQSRISPRSGG